MNDKLKLLIAVAFTVIGILGAKAAERYSGHCDIVFQGNSTLDSFSGTITNVPIEVVCTTNQAGRELLNTRIEIGARELTTHNTKRDANMYRMFRDDQFPRMLIIVSNAPLPEARLKPEIGNLTAGALPLEIAICGVTNQVIAKTSNPLAIPDGWEFELTVPLSLKSFKLKPPSMMLGTITVSDTVQVTAHVKAQKQSP